MGSVPNASRRSNLKWPNPSNSPTIMENSDTVMMEEKSEAQSVEPASFTEIIHTPFVSKTIESWPEVVSALEKRGLSGTLNLAEQTVTVSTTARTKDPKMLHNAWECIVYIAQVSIPVREALFFLDNEFDCIKIGYLEGGFALKYEMKQEVYNKKRDRLYEHLNEIQVLCKVTAVTTDDYISVGGATLLCLKRFRKVVERCIIGNHDPAKTVYALQNHQTGRMLRRLKISG